MIQFERITSTDHPQYPWMENLMTESFPSEERRDDEKQRTLINTQKDFFCNLLIEDGNAVGMMNYWQMDGFVYLEHFAVDPQRRNGGFGQQALNTLKSTVHSPIILEAEEPNDEMSKRRIGFYQRQGFILQETEYLQPPYREGDGFLPLKLMTYGELDMKVHAKEVIAQMYERAYEVKKA